MKKLYLVDVSGMFFRAFYAIRPLSTPSGLPVNALYGYLSMTVKLLREIKPDYMAFCFDRAEPSFRKEIDPNYKAHRKEMPADLVPQVPYVRKLTEALGIPCFDRLGFEADDIIGTLTHFGREQGLEVVIVSSDKDFGQLVRPFVTMYDTMKDVRYDEAGVLEKWGVEPRKIIDFLAMVGDSSDNVPGVAGIGEKGAQKLLSQFDSLDSIYENLESVSGAALKNKLVAGKGDAYLSQKLVTIVCDIPLGVKLDDLKMKPIERDELRQLLHELDFKSFARTLLGAEAQESTTSFGTSFGSSAGPSAGPSAEPVVANVASPVGPITSEGPGAASPSPQTSDHAPSVGLHVGPIHEKRLQLSELNSWLKPEAVTWALQTERGSYLAQAYEDTHERGGWTIAEIAADGQELGQLLDEKKLRLRGFDIKDFCRRHQMKHPIVDWDQMLAAYVVRAGHIEAVAPLFMLYNGEPIPELPSPTQLLLAHLKLETQLRRKVASLHAEKVLFEIEQPLVPILVSMEEAGVLIDTVELKTQSLSLGRDLQILEKEIHAEAGVVFNIGSPKQLGQILFEKMKMPTGKRTKTGFSTDNEVLEKLVAEFPITAKILHWRELSKLRSTYVDALPQLVSNVDGRVHTTFNQALTTTGRLSSTNPNLQNIPIRTERGNLIRKAFVAPPGRELLSADYSQIELRILAHITGDEGLVRAFEQGLDIHAATAAEVFEVPIADVTPEMRRKAKAVNFGLAYGQGAFGLAESLGIGRAEATEIINRYFARFSGVKTFMTDIVEEAKKKGYVETVFGRRRYIDELFAKSPAVRKFGERAAINAPIQGTASDLVKMAMIKVGLPEHSQPIMQVHDEIVLEVDSGHLESVSSRVKTDMESVAQLRVPLKINVGHGTNWDAAHS
jgi:DNA polymerase I